MTIKLKISNRLGFFVIVSRHRFCQETYVWLPMCNDIPTLKEIIHRRRLSEVVRSLSYITVTSSTPATIGECMATGCWWVICDGYAALEQIEPVIE